MRRKTTIFLFLMLFLVGFIPSRGASRVVPPRDETDSLPLRRAVMLTTDGQKRLHIYNDLEGSDSLFRLSIECDSTYAPAYFLLSQLLSVSGAKTDSVLYYAKEAYQRDTLNKWYSDFYAQALAVSGDYAKAIALYRKAIERAPQEPDPYIMVAMLHNQNSRPLEALSVLDSAELRTGKNSYISSMKRQLLVATGQRERAIAEAKELTVLEPDQINNHLILAEMYGSTGQDSLARVSYDAALQIDSLSLPTLYSLSQFCADRDNMPGFFEATKQIFRSPEESLERKIASFNRLTSDNKFYAKNFFSINELATQLYILYPSQKEIVELYAKHQIAAGSLDKALEVYKQHTSDIPTQYDYYSTIIDIESYLQRADSVEFYAARAIELFPDRHELKLAQANMYAYTERFDKALEGYQAVIETLPSDSLRGSIWSMVGDIYYQMQLKEKSGSSRSKSLMRKSYKAYQKSLELYPNNAMALNNYAYYLSLEKKDLGKALDMSGRAIALEEKNPTYLDTYAWVLFELGRYEEAKKIMRQVIALDTSKSADIQFHYAEILAALGEDFMAEVYYQKALNLGYDAQIINDKISNLK